MQENDSEYCSKSTLKLSGWTEVMIDRFLSTPDKEVPNPYYKSAAPMKLYKLSRVEAIESSQEFIDFKEKGKPRQEASEKAIKTKTVNLLTKVSQMDIFITRKNFEDIVKDAVDSYNTFKSNMAMEREDFDYQQASINSDKQFLNRITVNFLRYRCTPYERMLDRITGKVGKKEAYALLNQRIFNKIAEMYPELKSECATQLEQRIMGNIENGNN